MASTQSESTKKNTKKKPPKASRRNTIGDFLVEHVDGPLMRKYIADHKIKLDLDDDSSDEQVAVALVLWFKDNTPKDDWVRCDACQAVSSADLDACPFCGDSGDVEASDDEPATASDRSDADDAEDEDDDEDDSEEDDSDDDEDEGDGDVPDERAIAAAEENESKTEVAPPSEPEVTTAKDKKKEGSKMATSTTQVSGSGSKKSTALAKTHAAQVVTARDLDKAVSEVEKLKKDISESIFDAAESHYQLGKKLLEMNEGQLWKMRVDADTKKPAYKSWDQFVVKELGMSPQQSYAAIDIARGYETSDTLRAIGQTKAWRILQAAPQDRAQLIEEAKAGATVREVNAKVKKSRAKHGSPKKDKPQAKAGSKGAAKTNAAATTRSERVSVTSFEGIKTVKLYAKPDSMKGVDFSKLKRAKAIGDKPFGRVEMANGLVQTITVVKSESGEWVLKIETRREG